MEKEVADKLDELRASGQSYSGLLSDLVNVAEKFVFGRIAGKLHLMKPSDGPPLPAEWGIIWKGRRKKKKQQKIA